MQDLCLTEHSPELAAILLRDRPGSTLEGLKFTEFLATAEEASKAAELLKGRQQGGVSAHAFQTRLIDTSSSKFRTELFQVKYCKFGDAERHLIGLREITDQQSLARPDAQEILGPVQDPDDSSMSGYKLLASADYSSPPGMEPNRLSPQPSPSVRSLDGDRSDRSDRRVVYLSLDMDSCSVKAASVVGASLVGMRAAELFPGKGFELLHGLWAEVDRCQDGHEVEQLAQKQHFFKSWVVQWGPGQTDYVDGLVEILQNAQGLHYLLLRCTASTLSPYSSGRVTADVQGGPSMLAVLPGMPCDDKVLSLS